MMEAKTHSSSTATCSHCATGLLGGTAITVMLLLISDLLNRGICCRDGLGFHLKWSSTYLSQSCEQRSDGFPLTCAAGINHDIF